MQFIDTHIHLQDYKQKCATDIIEEMSKFGVQKLLCVSATEEDWEKVAILAQNNPQKIIPAFGLTIPKAPIEAPFCCSHELISLDNSPLQMGVV